MRMVKGVFIILFICLSTAFGQYGNAEIDVIQQNFKSFEYARAIENSDQLLSHKEHLSQEQIITVLQLRAQSHYALMHMDQALKDFKAILLIDPDFTLNPKTISPKIITFFNEIKNMQIQEQEKEPEPVKPTIQTITKTDTLVKWINNSNQITSCLKRSMILPGWGHIHNGQTKKGWFLLGANTITFAAAVYSIQDCSKARKDYISETNPDLIQDQYNTYNSAYKNRNILISVFAACWLYTQSDLLWFTDFSKANPSFSLLPEISPNGNSQITLSYKW